LHGGFGELAILVQCCADSIDDHLLDHARHAQEPLSQVFELALILAVGVCASQVSPRVLTELPGDVVFCT
jgi:hypothetical protein